MKIVFVFREKKKAFLCGYVRGTEKMQGPGSYGFFIHCKANVPNCVIF